MMNRFKFVTNQRLVSLLFSVGLLMAFSFAQAETANQDPSAFTRGAKNWAQNCARCHNMRDVKEYRDDQLKVIVNHMRVRAGLTGQEARDILLFLQENN